MGMKIHSLKEKKLKPPRNKGRRAGWPHFRVVALCGAPD